MTNQKMWCCYIQNANRGYKNYYTETLAATKRMSKEMAEMLNISYTECEKVSVTIKSLNDAK